MDKRVTVVNIGNNLIMFELSRITKGQTQKTSASVIDLIRYRKLVEQRRTMLHVIESVFADREVVNMCAEQIKFINWEMRNLTVGER